MEDKQRLVFRIATPWFWWTIYDPGQRWTVLRVLNVLMFVLLSPVVILAAVIASIVSKPATRTPDEVAQYLWNEAQGKSNYRDWDDFVSIPIADPNLDEIRAQAASLPQPLNDHRETLLELAAEARRLR
jgi:hypothetical protein